MDNDQYNQTELIRGRLYRYDPDFDAWYPVQNQEHFVNRWAWVLVALLLAGLCYYLEYLR